MVDLSQGDDDVLSTLKKACTSTGFFYGEAKPLPWRMHWAPVLLFAGRGACHRCYLVIELCT